MDNQCLASLFVLWETCGISGMALQSVHTVRADMKELHLWYVLRIAPSGALNSFATVGLVVSLTVTYWGQNYAHYIQLA